ncbi:flavin-containing monooxygenase [Pseudonocardia sp. HH130629-09]|uniref:flavin-containing monooxygenase n=1 Tax=Pseudonocardia sp. HH130629-09 TaxID=1641402 RepID=UPI0006CB44F3|nr:NAD(P)/FAD-dependent oxidoreductase [Pseudonocardia sp. HH130629-09]ALE84900.1 monooxygenase [Pseudonocardia sp. HH130629-09]
MTTCGPSSPPTDFDLAALRAKYAAERDRRLREDGSAQYVHTGAGERTDFWEADPHSPPVDRDAIASDVEVLVVGGGFAGLLAGAYLTEAGVTDVRIVDMGGDFGGVWYWNRYPGIQCDNEAYSYIPLLDELGYMPSQRFPDGAEIYEHCRNIGKHFGLYDGALFGTMIRAIRRDEETGRWIVTTNHDDELRARYVVLATGPWSKPKLPGIPGLDDFTGHTFHSARWDYGYTGGSVSDVVLDGLADKRVAVIGTGATAIQIVPHLGRHAQHVYVFQRTPSAVDERRNPPTDPAWAASLEPGWQKRRQAAFHAFASEPFPTLSPADDVACDFFTEVGRNVSARIAGRSLTPDELAAIREEEDYAVMERVRRRVDDIVQDPATAESLKPYYRYLCKRPCSSNEYLETFNRPNVTLVDVSGSRGVERMTARGVVAGGREHEVDCVIFASGFEISAQDQRLASGIDEIVGRDGLSLHDHWRDGFRTLHGMTSHGFPGMFFMGNTQGGGNASVTANYVQQGGHIAYIVAQAHARGATTVEPTRQAQDDWVALIRAVATPTTFLEQCTPGYYNNEGGGHGGIRPAVGDRYGRGFYEFDRLLRDWRDTGELPGMTLVGAAGDGND